MNRKLDLSLQSEIAFVLRLFQGAASGQATNSSTVLTLPPLNVDRIENDELRELVRTLTQHHGSGETTPLGTRRWLTMIVVLMDRDQI